MTGGVPSSCNNLQQPPGAATSSNPSRIASLQVEALLSTSGEWQFDAFLLAEVTGGRPLSCLGFFLLSEAGLIKQFAIGPSALIR